MRDVVNQEPDVACPVVLLVLLVGGCAAGQAQCSAQQINQWIMRWWQSVVAVLIHQRTDFWLCKHFWITVRHCSP